MGLDQVQTVLDDPSLPVHCYHLEATRDLTDTILPAKCTKKELIFSLGMSMFLCELASIPLEILDNHLQEKLTLFYFQ